MKINSRCSIRRADDGQTVKNKNLASREMGSSPRTWRNSALSILNVGSSLKALFRKPSTQPTTTTNHVFDFNLGINNSEKWYNVKVRG